MRIMGLDYGSKTVGVAISDALLMTAQSKEIIRRKQENKLRRTLARIEELILQYEVEEIVLGLPVNMDDTQGERVVRTREFKEMLERRTGLAVLLWDERLTTVEADSLMIEAGLSREERKERIDKVAASLILQEYLDERSRRIKEGRAGGQNRQLGGFPTESRVETGMKQEKITFYPENEDPVEFYVLEQTRLAGTDYLLVTDTEDEEGEALILKDLSSPEETESIYAIVSDDKELEAVAGVFEDLLEDITFISE
ncbi:MAG: Holliday junction resolvase RuvX [Lachnospiraceae bacterium]|nr:Holliday junction resolvase RuvX [Lachnospiraceae bacterium]